MPFQSGEFQIPGAISGAPKAAVVFDDMLYILDPYPGYNSQFSFDLSKLRKPSGKAGDDQIDAGALTNTANWVQQPLALPSSVTRPGLISFGAAMYTFINDYDQRGSLFASRLEVDSPGATGSWSAPIALFESDGATAPVATYAADVSATAVGDNIVIMACGRASSASNATGGTYIAVYDIRDIDTATNRWPAKWHDYAPIDNLAAIDSDFPVWTSVEWTTEMVPGDQPKGGVRTPTPAYRVTLAAQVDIGGDAQPVNFTQYAMTATGSTADGFAIALTRAGAMATQLWVSLAVLARDPAGRLRAWARLAGQVTHYEAYGIAVSAQVGAEGAGIGSLGLTFDVTNDNQAIVLPTAVYYTMPSPPPANPSDPHDYPVYEFVFYGSQGRAQVNRRGTARVVPGFAVRNTNSGLKTPLNILTGIIDGPIPLPLVNYRNYDPGPGQSSQGAMIYGLQNDRATSHESDSSLAVGFEAKGQVTKGFGPAFDISLKTGRGSAKGTASGSTTVYSLSVDAIVTAAPGNDAPTIVNEGAARSVGAEFSITAFSYLDDYGQNVDCSDNSASDGLKAASVSMTMVDDTIVNFTPYMVNPGVLESYTPEAINAKMKALGYTASANYFGDVLSRNAYPFTDSGNPFLSFSWGGDGRGVNSFSAWQSSFKETSWSLDLHAYGGVSGGTGASVFGLGEDFQWSFMAGVDYSAHTDTKSDVKSGWSIGLSENWGPPIRQDLPHAVARYDFRVYLLPVPKGPSTLSPTYWTQELIAHGNVAKIDPNSGCWKIAYVVTRIEYADGQGNYRYDGQLDVASVYPVTD